MSKTIDIGKHHSFVTVTSSQTAGMFDTIFEVDPPEGIFLGLEDNKPFIIKLLQTGGTEISLDSRLFLGAVGPGDTENNPHKLGEKPYSKYSLSYSDQSNNKKKSGLKFSLDLPPGEDEFIWNENETLVLQVSSGEQVDFSETGCVIETELNRYLGSPE